MASVSVHLGVLAIAKDPVHADLDSVEVVASLAAAAGHHVFARQAVADSDSAIRAQLNRWIEDREIDIVVVLSAESDMISRALAPLITRVIPGSSNVEAMLCGTTFVFIVPGAVGAAMDKILPQLDPATRPRNLVDQMPRLRGKPADAVPKAVPVEKTQGGSGLPSRIPAIPSGERALPRTGANVVSRHVVPDDPATKPIDVARLERQLAKSTTPSHDDVTRPGISLVLPRLPPGASDDDDDDDNDDNDETLDSDDDHTATDTVAVQPAPPLPPPRMPIPSLVKPKPRTSTTATPAGAVPVVSARGPNVAPPGASAREAKPFSFSTPLRGGPGGAPPSRSGGGPMPSREPTSSGTPAYSAKSATPSPPPAPPASSAPPAYSARSATPSPPPAPPAPPASPAAPARDSRPAAPPLKPPREPTASGTPAYAARSSSGSAPLAPEIFDAPDPDDSWTGTLEAAKAEAEAKDALEAKRAATAKAEADARAAADAREAAVRAEVARVEAERADTAAREAAARAELAAKDAIALRLAAERQAATEAAAKSREAIQRPAPPPPAVEAPRMRPPTPAPPPAVEAPRVRPPTPAPPLPVVRAPSASDDNDLPRGAFAYPTRPKRGNLVIKVVAALGATVLGFFAVVYFLDKKSEPQAKVATGAPTTPADAPAAGSAAGSADPEIEMDADDPPPTTAPGPRPRPATGSASTGPRPRPTPTPPGTGSASRPATAVTPPPPDKPDEADLCDEANCVLSDYDRPCCAKYKAKGPVISNRINGVPTSLDRSMVRAGVDGIKPRVIACGEKSGVKGTVKIAIAVSPEGAVTSADVQDSPDPGLGSCVAGALRSAKFGKSVEGGSFTYPFVF